MKVKERPSLGQDRGEGAAGCVCTCECVSFQLGTFGHYRDKSENRKGGSIKQDEGKTTTAPLPVSEGGRKQQIFEEFKSESSHSK